MRARRTLRLGGKSRSKANLGSPIPPTVDNGLVAWWDFEAGLDTTSDFGGPYSWAIGDAGAMTPLDGKVGNAGGFYGRIDCETEDLDSVLGLNDWTIAFWFKDMSVASGSVIDKFLSGDGFNLYRDTFNGNFIFRIYQSGVGIVLQQNFAFAPLGSDWHFMALSYSNSGSVTIVSFWLDGNKSTVADLNAPTIPVCRDDLALVNLSSGTNQRHDSLCIFNKALSDDEVATLYNSGSGHNYASWSAL